MARRSAFDKASEEVDVDERLDDLELNLKRLRIEYEQYFAGILQRPPDLLKGRVQKAVLYFAGNMPRNTRQKFRFNQLNARFQVFRQQWGRTLREIENGTYRRHVFKAKLRAGQRPIADERPAGASAATSGPTPKAFDKLYDAFMRARRKAGDHSSGPNRERVAELVRKQTATLRQQHGDAKIKFKVVIEGGTAKLKGTLAKG